MSSMRFAAIVISLLAGSALAADKSVDTTNSCSVLDGRDCYMKPECVLCKNFESGETACVPERRAEELDTGSFTCVSGASKCDALPESQCVSSGCVWCTSAAVGAACYSVEDSKKLPSAIFSCSGGAFA